MHNNFAYSQVKNSISVAAEENGVDFNFKKKQIKSNDYETLLHDTIHQSSNNIEESCTSDVDLIKNLLDPSLIDLTQTDEAMTLINNEKQPNSRHLQHSYSTDFHHLYPNSSSIDGQTTHELERLRRFKDFLIKKIQFLTNENQSIVDKSREQLSTIRTEKSHEEQLSSMKSQLSIQENTIDGLAEEAKLWKNQYLDLNAKHQKLIKQSEEEKIECKKSNEILRKRNDELEVDLDKISEEKKELEAENKRLNNRLFHATTELEQMKKSADSCELLKKDRLRSQQNCHVISEKLESCKVKLEQSTNLFKEKSCLVDQQKIEIKDLYTTVNDLKKVNSLNQLEIEKNKNRIEHLESRLKEKEDLVDEYKTLYHEIKNARDNEVKHEHHTIKALVMINSRYEVELGQLKAYVEKIRYDDFVNSKSVPDLIKDKQEHDVLNRLKKRYTILKDIDCEEVYEPVDVALLNESSFLNGDRQNGHIVAKNKIPNGNVNKNSKTTSTDLNGSTPNCATSIISETALPS